MAKKKTNQDFIDEIYTLVGDEYIFLEKYINNATKILCRHNKCGHEWKVRPSQFLQNHRCPMCHNRKLTYSKVKDFVEGAEGNGCKLLSEKYKNNYTKMLFKCNCGNEFRTTFARFKDRDKRQCNDCGSKLRRKNRAHSYEYVKNYIEIKSGSDCKLLSKTYNNSMEKLCIKCKCGNEFEATFDNFKFNNKVSCNECSNSNVIDYWIYVNTLDNNLGFYLFPPPLTIRT